MLAPSSSHVQAQRGWSLDTGLVLWHQQAVEAQPVREAVQAVRADFSEQVPSVLGQPRVQASTRVSARLDLGLHGQRLSTCAQGSERLVVSIGVCVRTSPLCGPELIGVQGGICVPVETEATESQTLWFSHGPGVRFGG